MEHIGLGVYHNAVNVGNHIFSRHIINEELEHRGGTREYTWQYTVFRVVTRGDLPFINHMGKLVGNERSSIVEKRGTARLFQVAGTRGRW